MIFCDYFWNGMSRCGTEIVIFGMLNSEYSRIRDPNCENAFAKYAEMLITPVKINKRPRGNKWARIFEFKLLACFKHRQFMMILLQKYVPSKTLLILWKTISELVHRSEGFLICSSAPTSKFDTDSQ
jgi:hypothetical protein